MILRHAVSQKITDGSEMITAAAFIAMMMEAVSAFETSVEFFETRSRKSTENRHIHTSSQNLKFNSAVR
jgi:hypothetical protein